MSLRPIVLILSLLLAPTLVVAAKQRLFIDEPEPPASSSIQEGEAWQERKIDLPPWPQDGDLVEFRLDDPAAPISFRYFIDGRNLSVGSDGVVRYTLVAQSASGARNVTYEGLRCTAQGVFRVYAYGSANRFTPVDDKEWQIIIRRPGDELHRELHGFFLCGPRTFEPRPVKDMIRALKGQIRGRENAGFQAD